MRRILQPGEVVPLALGAAVLGTGGGGDPYIGRLALQREIERNGCPALIDLDDLADDALVVTVAMGGAPVVGLEKLISDSFADVAVRRLEAYLGKKVDAVMPLEIGGINSLLPFMTASRTGLPVVDADGMGRAFPTLDKTSFSILGLRASPLMTCNEHGDGAVIDCKTDLNAELVSRAVLVQLGAACCSALFPMSGLDARRTAISGSASLALSIGQAIEAARHRGEDPCVAIIQHLKSHAPQRHVRILFAGKVTDVQRTISGGFNFGRGRLAGLDCWNGEATFDFQNEYSRLRDVGGLLAVVPDLLCFLDGDTGDPVTCETLRYGQRIKVLGISCAPVLRTAAGLRACGPSAFGFSEAYQPIETLTR